MNFVESAFFQAAMLTLRQSSAQNPTFCFPLTCKTVLLTLISLHRRNIFSKINGMNLGASPEPQIPQQAAGY
jgi:hypothetical protein